MIETFIIAATTFFATVGPFDVAAIYAALTTQANAAEKRKMAARGVLLAGGYFVFFRAVWRKFVGEHGRFFAGIQHGRRYFVIVDWHRNGVCASFRRRLNNPGGKPGRCGKKRCLRFFRWPCRSLPAPAAWVQSYYCRPKQKMTTLYRRRFWAG